MSVRQLTSTYLTADIYIYDTYDMVYQWRKFVDDFVIENGGDVRVLMTEAYSDVNHTMLYYGTPDGSTLGAHFAFNFHLITDLKVNSTAQDVVNSVNRWLDAMPDTYTSNWVLGNHDQRRVATRLGPDNVDGFNMLKAVLPGVAVTYNGEEIGQEDGEVSFEEGQDPSVTSREDFERISRDFQRTPYQWDDSVNAGFNTGAKPWLPVSNKYHETNLKKQKETDGPSHYKLYRNLSKLRQNIVIVKGNFEIKALAENVILVKRRYRRVSITLLFNKSVQETTIDVTNIISAANTVLLSSVNSSRRVGSILQISGLNLAPHEAVITLYAS